MNSALGLDLNSGKVSGELVYIGDILVVIGVGGAPNAMFQKVSNHHFDRIVNNQGSQPPATLDGTIRIQYNPKNEGETIILTRTATGVEHTRKDNIQVSEPSPLDPSRLHSQHYNDRMGGSDNSSDAAVRHAHHLTPLGYASAAPVQLRAPVSVPLLLIHIVCPCRMLPVWAGHMYHRNRPRPATSLSKRLL